MFGERRKSARTSRRSPKQTPHQPAPLALLPHTATHTAIGCTLSQAEKGREGGGDPLPLSRLQQQQAARLLLCLRRRLSCRFNRRLQTETIGEPRHSRTMSDMMSTPRRIIAAAQQSLLRLLQLPLSLLRLSSSSPSPPVMTHRRSSSAHIIGAAKSSANTLHSSLLMSSLLYNRTLSSSSQPSQPPCHSPPLLTACWPSAEGCAKPSHCNARLNALRDDRRHKFMRHTGYS